MIRRPPRSPLFPSTTLFRSSRGFALHASAGQRAALRAKLGELAVPAVASDKVALLAIKNQFYDILIEGCGNLVAGQMLRQLNNRVTVLRRISMSQPGRLDRKSTRLNSSHLVISHA